MYAAAGLSMPHRPHATRLKARAYSRPRALHRRAPLGPGASVSGRRQPAALPAESRHPTPPRGLLDGSQAGERELLAYPAILSNSFGESLLTFRRGST